MRERALPGNKLPPIITCYWCRITTSCERLVCVTTTPASPFGATIASTTTTSVPRGTAFTLATRLGSSSTPAGLHLHDGTVALNDRFLQCFSYRVRAVEVDDCVVLLSL